MGMKVRIGIGPIPIDGPEADVGPGLAELVDELEAHRVDSVWLSDLVSSRHSVDPMIGLAYAAGRTERLKLGTGVLVLPGRNPALVAAQLAALAAVAPGRVLPAFGVRPAQPLDLGLGGRLPIGMGRIGRLGDGLLGSFLPPEEAAVCRAQIERAAV